MRPARIAIAVTVATVVLGAASLVAQQKPPAAPQKPDHMEHRFDNPEQLAKQFDDPARDAWQMPDRVIAALGLKAGQSVADIGAGTGYFSVRLARSAAAPAVYAVDIEAAMVDHLTKRAHAEHLMNIMPVRASATSPNLPKPVDMVLVVDTFHHIGNRTAYFRELKKSLTPGGRVAIVDFHKDSPQGPPLEFRFTAEQIASEMAKAGYTLEVRHDFLPRQTFQIFRQ